MIKKQAELLSLMFKLNRTINKDQSVENAGVAFVKGASERNDFFTKINKQLYVTNKSGRTRQRTNNLRDELIWGMNSVR